MMKWTDEASKKLGRISRKYRLDPNTYCDLVEQSEQWAQRRIADADAKGYDDDPRNVIGSDVGYSWAYMMMCMPRGKQS